MCIQEMNIPLAFPPWVYQQHSHVAILSHVFQRHLISLLFSEFTYQAFIKGFHRAKLSAGYLEYKPTRHFYFLECSLHEKTDMTRHLSNAQNLLDSGQN